MDASEHRQFVWTSASVRLLLVGYADTLCNENAGFHERGLSKCFVSSEVPNSHNSSVGWYDLSLFYR